MKIIQRVIMATIISVIVLSSCSPVGTPASTKTYSPASSSTSVPSITAASSTHNPPFTDTPILATETPPSPTVLATQPESTYAVITPEPTEIEQWREYEEALGNAIYERVLRTDILCEWLIVGRAEREVYVWAACSGFRPYDSKLTTYSRYAVVYLGVEGDIQIAVTGENIPGSPAESRRKLFPPGILERFEQMPPVDRLLEHLETRREYPEPPLIVLDATPSP